MNRSIKSHNKYPKYVIYKNSIDYQEYGIQGKYKKNPDKYKFWYGKLKNAPSDIMVTGYPVFFNHKKGFPDVDSTKAVTLRVKDLES
jgi:hypothetical protein